MHNPFGATTSTNTADYPFYPPEGFSSTPTSHSTIQPPALHAPPFLHPSKISHPQPRKVPPVPLYPDWGVNSGDQGSAAFGGSGTSNRYTEEKTTHGLQDDQYSTQNRNERSAPNFLTLAQPAPNTDRLSPPAPAPVFVPPRIATPVRITPLESKETATVSDFDFHRLLRAAVLEAGYTSRHATWIVDYYMRAKSQFGGGVRFPEYSCMSDVEHGRLGDIFDQLRAKIRNDEVIPILLDDERPLRRMYVVNTLKEVDERILNMEFSAATVKEAVRHHGRESGLNEARCPLFRPRGNKTEISNFTKEWDILKQSLTPWEIEDWRYNSIPIVPLVYEQKHTWGRVMPEVFSDAQLQCRVATTTDQVYYEADPGNRQNLIIGLSLWTRTIKAVNMISRNPNVDIQAILLKRKRLPPGKYQSKKNETAEDIDDDNDSAQSAHEDKRKHQKTGKSVSRRQDT